jgi:iron complex outermembrane receptor protein
MIGVALLLAAAVGAPAATPPPVHVADLADLTLEQLANVVVTSVSRREERLSDAAASIYVIGGDEIRRSGATTLPEALRLAPNLDVARADANQYAVSARGFNNVLANKLLVLIDGRTVYSPLFSGVFWEAQDVVLEDIERIEVVSGPGATLWGANAVNGVINIISKNAGDTQRALLAGGHGTHEGYAVARYGGAAGDARYRIYAKYGDQDNTELANGTPIRDSSYRRQAGFRVDWSAGARSATVQGDAYSSSIDQAPAARTVSGANVLARFAQDLGAGSALRAQAYYDHTERTHPGTFANKLDTLDIDAQYELKPHAAQRVMLGGGYRFARDRSTNTASVAFLPPDRDLHWAHAFVQDEIDLGHDVSLTAGIKAEDNSYTGVEWLPNVRLAARLSPQSVAWGALSRAVRAPSRIDREFYSPGQPPFAIAGGPDFRSEIAKVAEIGWRSQPIASLSYSITLFYADYDRLRSLALSPAGAVFANDIEGTNYGVEAWGSLRINERWRIVAGGTAMHERLRVRTGGVDLGALASLGNDPRAWWSVRSYIDLTPQHDIDISLRHVGERPGGPVPAYTAVDARWGFRVTPALTVSLLLQNLFDPRHAEWGPPVARAELERAAFVKIDWRL